MPARHFGLQSRSESNQRQIRYGCGYAPRKTIYRRNGLQVGVSDAVLTATPEITDVTAGRDRQPNSHFAPSSGGVNAGRIILSPQPQRMRPATIPTVGAAPSGHRLAAPTSP